VQLLVIRHAPAEDRDAFALTNGDDRERPLTAKGERRMRGGARALARLLPELDVLVSSPLRRALQTATIVANAYGGLEVIRLEALSPGASRAERVGFLERLDPGARVALVGHAPDLDEDVSWLLAGVSRAFVRIGKGAACLLDLPGNVDAARAELRWSLSLGQLRRLR
jgi:phosphohistidine phosphatase